MDGNAIVAAFASTPGPDCLRDVLPKVGQRMKVYMAMKRMMEVYKTISVLPMHQLNFRVQGLSRECASLLFTIHFLVESTKGDINTYTVQATIVI